MDANIPVNVTVSNGFVNGIWSGAVSVPAGAHDLVLRAVDDDGHSGVSDPFTMVQLRIASVSRSGSGIEIRFETLAGSHYIVQTSSSPVGPWSNASGILTGDGTPIQFLHSPSGTAFYRVTLVPATP
jgi:hypothetical protein